MRSSLRPSKTLVLVAALAAVVFAGAFALGRANVSPPTPVDPGLSSPDFASTAGEASSYPSPVAGATQPADAATGWLRTSRTLDWTDPSATAWTGRVQPYVTDALLDTYTGTGATGPGVEWTEFVEKQCSTRVVNSGTTVPDEAPRTDTTVFVQVAGQVVTSCLRGQPTTPSEDAAATLEVVRASDGNWRVNKQLF